MSAANDTPKVALLRGGDTSDALCDATAAIIDAAGVSIDWHPVPAGTRAVDQCGEPMPESTIEAVRAAGLALKPLLRTPVELGDYTSPNVTLRKALGVWAGVRRIRSLSGVPSRYQDVDILLVRELTEGTYAGIEHRIVPGVVQTIKVMTEAKCESVIRHAFEEARRRGREHVTLVHKANIMKMSDGMFRRVGRRLAEEYSDIGYSDIIADNAAMQMVARPEQFDVLVAGNLFGDILGDVGAGLVGSSLLVTSINAAEGATVFEATHHVGGATTDADHPGASPLALLMPALDLLDHLGEGDARGRITDAISAVLADGSALTPDHGGAASTKTMADAIIAAIE